MLRKEEIKKILRRFAEDYPHPEDIYALSITEDNKCTVFVRPTYDKSLEDKFKEWDVILVSKTRQHIDFVLSTDYENKEKYGECIYDAFSSASTFPK